MTIKTYVCNGYKGVCGKHRECSVINRTTENLDQYRKPLFANRNTNGDIQKCSSSTRWLMTDEHFSKSEITGETS